jgi:hypothetical protein
MITLQAISHSDEKLRRQRVNQNRSQTPPQRSKRTKHSLQPVRDKTASYRADHKPTDVWQKRRGTRSIVVVLAAA